MDDTAEFPIEVQGQLFAMNMANRVTFSSNNNGSGNGWHKDAYRKQFKSLLYLNNVDNNNGPFQLLKKSNKILFLWYGTAPCASIMNFFPNKRQNKYNITL